MSNDTNRDRPERPASGRFVVRIEPELHEFLRTRARSAGISLNRYCARELGSPSSELPRPAGEAVRRASSILGESLLGVVLFGSWMRGESSGGSDLDILVVADRRVAITRRLYREWDELPGLQWAGHTVEPHFVHLLAGGETPSGLWAEVAIDGVVLFERRLAVSLALASVRRRIQEERVTRRIVQGNPYWVRES